MTTSSNLKRLTFFYFPLPGSPGLVATDLSVALPSSEHEWPWAVLLAMGFPPLGSLIVLLVYTRSYVLRLFTAVRDGVDFVSSDALSRAALSLFFC